MGGLWRVGAVGRRSRATGAVVVVVVVVVVCERILPGAPAAQRRAHECCVCVRASLPPLALRRRVAPLRARRLLQLRWTRPAPPLSRALVPSRSLPVSLGRGCVDAPCGIASFGCIRRERHTQRGKSAGADGRGGGGAPCSQLRARACPVRRCGTGCIAPVRSWIGAITDGGRRPTRTRRRGEGRLRGSGVAARMPMATVVAAVCGGGRQRFGV